MAKTPDVSLDPGSSIAAVAAVPATSTARFVEVHGEREGRARAQAHARWQAARRREETLHAQVLRTAFPGRGHHQGRPVLAIRPATFTDEALLDQLEQRLADLADELLAASDRQADGFIAVVVDMDGYAFTPMHFRVALRCVGTMRDQYPERMGSCAVLNSGLVWGFVWACVRPLLPERSARKVEVVEDDPGGHYYGRLLYRGAFSRSTSAAT